MAVTMQISQLKNIGKSNKKKSISPLAKKWQAIRRQLNQNANLRKKMCAFFELYEKSLGHHEGRFLKKRMELVEHLCSYIPRKTITNYAMENLLDFIDVEMLLISQHPFYDNEAVQELHKLRRNKLQERQDVYSVDTKTIDALRAYIESLPWMSKEFSDDDISEFIRDPEMGEKLIEEGYQEWLKDHPEDETCEKQPCHEGFEDWIDGVDDFFYDNTDRKDDSDEEEAFDALHEQSSDTENLLKTLMKSEEINRLYKKLANLLHPDKLTDTSKQAEYLAAMKELITARKNKDIFELLTLAQKYFPNHDLAIDKKQEKQLSFALDKKLKELQDEYFIIYDAPTPISVLWRKFHDKNKRQQEYNLEQQKEWLNNMIKETDSIIRETSNVKNIKAFLRDHYESLSSEVFTRFQDEFISAYDTPDFDFDKPPF